MKIDMFTLFAKVHLLDFFCYIKHKVVFDMIIKVPFLDEYDFELCLTL